jgi:hypothetical protein
MSYRKKRVMLTIRAERDPSKELSKPCSLHGLHHRNPFSEFWRLEVQNQGGSKLGF